MKKLTKSLLLMSFFSTASIAQAGLLHAVFTTSFTLVGASLGRLAGSATGPRIAQFVGKQTPKDFQKLIASSPHKLKYSVIEATEFTGMLIGGMTFYHGARER